MKNPIRPLTNFLKAIRDLGPKYVWLYGRYQLALRSGYLRWRSKPRSVRTGDFHPLPVEFPDSETLRSTLDKESQEKLLEEASLILEGKMKIFGNEVVDVIEETWGRLRHWTYYERSRVGQPGEVDIKYQWEPNRFGWAHTLMRAYRLTSDPVYVEAFWGYTEEFLKKHPAYMGPQWASAQEVAIRLISLAIAGTMFEGAEASTPQRMKMLAKAIGEHAQRIPYTLGYARAQNNNHLIMEALGLYIANLAIPDHLFAPIWKPIGWQWLNWAFQNQIADDGTYTQHSTNYHRLVLQAGLLYDFVSTGAGEPLGITTKIKLAAATRWLAALYDPVSGRVPNLGHNDGAYIFPWTVQPFDDYRPVLQAACLAFLGQRIAAPGPWDEMAAWHGLCSEGALQYPIPEMSHNCVMRPQQSESWAYVRAATFHDRPGHADQLHLDMWWNGDNVLLDPGTYVYNAPHPWNNSLMKTEVHNTVEVNGRDQMTRAGRFLYLDRAQGRVIRRETRAGSSWQQVVLRHNGYRRHGAIHQRKVTYLEDDHWQVEDRIRPLRIRGQFRRHQLRLHWLMPDYPWEITTEGDESLTFQLDTPNGLMRLTFQLRRKIIKRKVDWHVQVIRAGEMIHGVGEAFPTLGWSSPTYGQKIPALSLGIIIASRLPAQWTTDIELFPGISPD